MKQTFVTLLLLSLLTVGCGPDPDEMDVVSDYDIVYTTYDQSANFSTYMTYALPDKIPYLDGQNNTTDSFLDNNNQAQADLIRNQVRTLMNARGYQEVNPNTQVPDMLFNLGVFSTNNSSIYSSDCWWYGDSYYWDWYGDWDWNYDDSWDYYPCYGSYVYSYQYGSLVMDIVDTKNTTTVNCNQPGSNCNLKILWNGIINGLLVSNSTSINTRITNGIQQAFNQSLYLKK